ncbi:TetR/AcrR family transcriptional regulator [Nonomuraea wenchangensis]|uniref:Transcriptional regulator, TetR family n=1 Tax=Nonomuraea wenchangensis TaxID=568860 RepID=A0A1I0AN59_9ACTN|nr:TetR family transcriptional regulator [Nonomuraea wenchangensis]SES95186.1 transcriptional regulator, TetR family [Nonomuraea wenchangensis]
MSTAPGSSDTPRRTRRSPQPQERQRDAERTKARILEAAIVEVSAVGPAQVRVAAIAARAGVNKQLISYYFGGRDGLLRAIGERWREQKVAFQSETRSLPDVIADYVGQGAGDAVATRILAWEGLHYDGPEHDPDREGRREQAARDVAELRQRQERGELADDLDPAVVLLAMIGAGVAPVLLPHMANAICGADAQSPEFVAHYTEQMRRIARRLSVLVAGADEEEGEGRRAASG